MFPQHSAEICFTSRGHETHLDDEAAGEDEDETDDDGGCVKRVDEADQSGVTDAAGHHDNDNGDKSDTKQ